MANVLPIDRQVAVISALAEGMSIRSVERITGVHRDTIMRLGVRVGEACTRLLDEKMRRLESRFIEVDEIWGFVGKKHRNTNANDDTTRVGSIWTYVAVDRESRIVPTFRVGPRDGINTQLFVEDLARRVKNRIQLTTDGMNSYLTGVEEAFGHEIDYGQVVKKFNEDGEDPHEHRRYSPPTIIDIKRTVISGDPDFDEITTGHVEAQNLTMRCHIRRLTRLTNAFSKKFENLRAAIGLHFAYYNFCLRHSALRMTPAMAAGIASTMWGVEDLVGLANP